TFFGVSNNQDSAFWCNENFFITPGSKDSFFEFTLQPVNPNIPIYDSIIDINWFANFSSNHCTSSTPVSGGTIQLIPTVFQFLPVLDTVTATASTPNCDPIFNFTVHNRNSLRASIAQVSFEVANPSEGNMRPSDVVP